MFEQAKVFMRSFFRDDDIDCRDVCQMAKRFSDYVVEDPALFPGEISTRRAVTFLQMVDKPLSFMELKIYLEAHDPDRLAMSFIEFALLYYDKPLQDLFTKDFGGNLEFLRKKNALKSEIRKLVASKENVISEEENKNDQMAAICAKIEEVTCKLHLLEEEMEREGSPLDEVLMELDLHEEYPQLFEIM